MSVVLVILVFAAGLSLAVLRGIAADEVRGRIERRITASVEATIASLPPELQDEWADEWRGEIAAAMSMPITATLLARGLRHSASQFIADAEITRASTRRQQRTALKHAPKVVLRAAGTVMRRALVKLAYGLAATVALGVTFVFSGVVVASSGTVTGILIFGLIVMLVVLEHKESRARVTPADRLRAVLEGRADGLVLTAEQTREIEAMLKSWAEPPPRRPEVKRSAGAG